MKNKKFNYDGRSRPSTDLYKENFNIVDKFSEKHYSPGTFDLFIGLVFALIGEPEVFNSEVTECLRNPGWQTSGHPIVHQYREYYEQSDFYGVPAWTGLKITQH